MRFRARKDRWFARMMWAIGAGCYVLAVLGFFIDVSPVVKWAGAAILVLNGAACHSAVLRTFYVIEQDRLNIAGGFFYRRTIPLAKIKSIRRIVSLESSAALSKKRLRIFTRFDYVDVSPEQEEAFIRQLKEAAPHIRVEDGTG